MIKYEVTDLDDARRVDRVLKSYFSDFNYAFLQKIFRKGRIKVNGRKVQPSEKVRAGDIVEIFADISAKPEPQRNEDFRDHFAKLIIFETPDFLMINKPAKLAVQGGSGVKICVEMLMLSYDKNCRLVHRLDKDTSGALLIAKNPQTAKVLAEKFKNSEIQKTYYAITHNRIEKKVVLESFLDKKFIGGREMVVVADSGKYAKTIVEPVYSNEKFSLLKLTPLTGRKHQLRVHLATLLNSPIVGDTRYGNDDADRLYLHAYKIVIDGKTLNPARAEPLTSKTLGPEFEQVYAELLKECGEYKQIL